MKHLHYLIIAAFIITACARNGIEETLAPDNDIISLTKVQAERINVSVGKISKRTLADHVMANGKLDVPPQNMVTVSAPLGGFVKSTNLLEGMKVNKGSVIARMENLDYIELQQSYLDAASKLRFLQSEYDRQVALARENVNAEKTLQQAKSQFESQLTIVNGLAVRLSLINIPTSSLSSGNIQSTINLYAPISGYVTAVNVSPGQFVNTADVMFRMVNLEHVHVELYVYEKDIMKVALGQNVRFKLLNSDTIATAQVFLIGKEIGNDRTVRVHCHLKKEDPSLLPGMFVTAEIEVSAVEAEVVPQSAIAIYNGEAYIFLRASADKYKPVIVKTGRTDGDYTEILLPPDFDKDEDIVLNGSYELLGLVANKAEEE